MSVNFKATMDSSDIRKKLEEIRKDISRTSGVAESEGRRMEEAFKRVGAAVGGVFAGQRLAGFARQVATVRGEFQQLEAAYRTMLGSREKADRLMRESIDFAATTPFDVRAVASGTKQLLAYGSQAAEVSGELRMLGDIAAGLSIPLNDIVYLYGTTRAQGRLFTMDLRQFMGRGIPLAEELAKQFGVTTAEVGQLVTDGKVGFEEVRRALAAMTSEGGKFAGLMDAQSKTISGQISNLGDSVQQMLNNIGKASEGVISGAIGATAKVVENYREVGKALLEIIAAYGAYKAAVIAVSTVQKVHIRLLEEAAVQQSLAAASGMKLGRAEAMAAGSTQLLSRSLKGAALAAKAFVTSTGGIATIAVALGYAIYRLATYQTDYQKSLEEMNDSFDEGRREANAQISALAQLKGKLSQLKEGTEEYAETQRRIAETAGEYGIALKAEEVSVESLAAKYGELTAAITASYDARQYDSFTKTANDNWADTLSSELDDEIYNKLLKKYGDETGTAIYQNIKQRIFEAVAEGEKLGWNQTEWRAGPAGTSYAVIDKGEGYIPEEIKGEGKMMAAWNRIAKAYRDYLKIIEQADRKFAGRKKPQTSGGDAGGDGEDAVKSILGVDYRAAEKEWKTARARLAEMAADREKFTTEQYRAAVEQEKSAREAYEALGGNTKGGGGKSGADNDTQDRLRRIAEYGDSVKEAQRKAEMDITQSKIDAMNEGLERQREQNRLNYDRMLLDNERRQREMVEKYRDYLMNVWMLENPKADKGQVQARRAEIDATVGAEQLPSEQKAIIAGYAEMAGEIYRNANKRALESSLSDVMDYLQRRTKIETDAAEKIAAMYETGADGQKQFRQGFGQGNVSEAEYARDEALKAIDLEFASREESFQAWCNEITEMTKRQLEEEYEKAKQELEKARAEGDNNGTAVASAKMEKAKQQISSLKKVSTSPDRRSIKEWEDLYKVLNQVSSVFKELGKTIGGTAGEFISAAGEISASTMSMVRGISELAMGTIDATEKTATGAAAAMTGTAEAAVTAIRTVETASVILAVIGAALQIAQQVIGLITGNREKAHKEEIEALQSRIDQLQWELDNAGAKKTDDAIGDEIRAMAEYAAMMDRLGDSAYAMWRRTAMGIKDARKSSEIMNDTLDAMAEKFVAVKYTVDKSLGEGRYKDARDSLKNISEQVVLLQEQIDSEKGVKAKKRDEEAISDWEQKQIELTQQAVEMVNDLYEDLMGGSAADWAEELGDAFFDAFGQGEDAAEAWGKKVDEIVGNVVKKMLVQRFLEEPMGEIFDRYKSKLFNEDGTMRSLGEFNSAMTDMAGEIKGMVGNFSSAFSTLPDELKEMLAGDAEREASSKGIATASQESVDELNGRMTAVQGHTYSIAENTKLLVANTADILDVVQVIETHTRRMESIESGMRNIGTKMDDIARQGLKIK